MLNAEQASEVRNQLMKQIESTFPPEKKDSAKKQVESMSEEELEKFVKGNNQENSCIFCSIISGDSESYKIAENDSAVAILEINPVSRGHTLVLPKKHGSFREFPELRSFAETVGKILREKLSPRDVEIASLDFQGHGVINLIPVYTNESIESPRHKASRQELEEVSSILNKKEEIIKQEKPKTKRAPRKPRIKKLNPKKNWLPKRIP